jgi:hypothetical protein
MKKPPAGIAAAAFGKGPLPDQRFENWNRLRAPGWPAFLRSFSRGSRRMWPAFLRAGLSSAFIFWRARAMPCATAPAWPATPPPGDVRGHVDLLAEVDRQERGVGLLGEVVVREIAVERASVDDQLAAAVGDPHAGRRGLAAAGPVKMLAGVLMGSDGDLHGLLASCGCFVPANTRSFVSILAARRFLGSIPLTACMITNSGRLSRICLRLR